VRAIERRLTAFFVGLCIVLAATSVALSWSHATKMRSARVSTKMRAPRQTLTLQEAQAALARDWDRIRIEVFAGRGAATP
jgi:hypothetical protein